jgi:hypothetical protein
MIGISTLVASAFATGYREEPFLDQSLSSNHKYGLAAKRQLRAESFLTSSNRPARHLEL